MTSSDRARRAAEQTSVPRRALYVLAGIVIAAVSVLGALYFIDRTEAANQRAALRAQLTELADDAKDVADPLAELCRTDPSVAARAGEGCRKAVEVQAQPEPTPVVTVPTSADLRTAVADYLRRNPPPAGQAASLDQITAAVAGYLTTHPPAPGRAPTAEEIRSAVAVYLAENPPPAGQNGTDGQDGQDGQDAPPITDAQIDAAVARYLADNPPPAGPPGEQGVQGPPGPTCPSGYELRAVVLVAADGSTYDGLGCVRPESSSTPTTTEQPDDGLLPTPRGGR